MTYLSVVSRDSVQIARAIAALNDLDVLACDIHNAYLTADCRERVGVVFGAKFGFEAEKNMLAEKVLYGLKSSGAAFRDLLAETLDAMGYWLSYSDPNLWLRPTVKPDGYDYYEYLLFCVDNVLCISHNPQKLMKRIQEDFNLKDNKIKHPNVYLGAKISNM